MTAEEVDLTDEEFRRIQDANGLPIGAYGRAEIEWVIGERLAALLHRMPEVSTRRTDWGVRDDATGHVGVVGAYSRAATEAWLAELTDPSTLMRRERTTYRDQVTEWVEVSLPPECATDDGDDIGDELMRRALSTWGQDGTP